MRKEKPRGVAINLSIWFDYWGRFYIGTDYGSYLLLVKGGPIRLMIYWRYR